MIRLTPQEKAKLVAQGLIVESGATPPAQQTTSVVPRAPLPNPTGRKFRDANNLCRECGAPAHYHGPEHGYSARCHACIIAAPKSRLNAARIQLLSLLSFAVQVGQAAEREDLMSEIETCLKELCREGSVIQVGEDSYKHNRVRFIISPA